MRRKNKAFTLAEVLITLGIIGVIAALTLPTLVQNANSAKTGPELANAVNTLENAIQQFMTDNNADYISVAMEKAGGGTTLQELFNSYLFEHSVGGGYIKAVNLTNDTYLPSSSVKWSGAAGGLSGNGAAWVLQNKSMLRVEVNDCALNTATDAVCGVIFYTSGYQKKVQDNKLVTGRDVFKINVVNNGSVLPEGQTPGHEWWTTTNNCDDSGIKNATASGVGCAGRIASKGWKVDY